MRQMRANGEGGYIVQIERIKLADVKPYRLNAKDHPKKQIEQIKRSIQAFGFNDPIAIDQNNEIIEGHGRAQAVKELGAEYIDVIRLSHLTDQQKRAYVLVHNKLTMDTGFKKDMLKLELEEIADIDMTEFGFELPKEIELPDYKAETQEMKENILNLGYAQFAGVGKYDIPEIEPVTRLPKIEEWVGFNYVLSEKNPKNKGVHFFVDDYQFERVWNNPGAYIDKLSKFAAVMSPDFSPYGDMPIITQMFNHYRKHWVGAYWQSKGLTVIPTIRSSTDPRSFEWYLDGEPRGGIVAYSSMWIRKDREDIYRTAEEEWAGMIKTLKPVQIIVYGKKFDFMKGNVTVIDKFTDKRWKDDNK